MGDIYEVLLDDKMFEKIKNGKCFYYIFLNDRIRLQYKIGNILTLKNNEDSVKVEIKNLFYFNSIKELLEMMGKEKLGFSSSQNSDKIEDFYYVNYKPSDIEKFGLVVVEFKQN